MKNSKKTKLCLLAPPKSPKSAKSEGLDEFARKRRFVWSNAERNRFVAAVAGACLRGDRDGLEGHGIPRLKGTPAGVWRVAVLVESLEHARILQRLLAGWGIRTKSPAIPRPDPAQNGGCIVTWTDAEMHALRADYVVRADGSACRLPASLRPSSGHRPRVAIDFIDNMDKKAVVVSDWRVQIWESTYAGLIHRLPTKHAEA